MLDLSEPKFARACTLRLRQNASKSRGSEGFTLLEVIVALAVLSVSLTLLFGSFSSSLHYQRRARALAEATLLAQSLLARVGNDIPLRLGTSQGVFPGDFTWEIQTELYGDAADRQEWPVSAYTVSVRLFEQGAGKGVPPAATLTTLRLGPRPQTP